MCQSVWILKSHHMFKIQGKPYEDLSLSLSLSLSLFFPNLSLLLDL